MESLNIFIKSIFIDNMVFAYFFGMCSYIAVSKSVKTANGLGLAVIFVMMMTVPLNWLLNEYILKPGALQWISDTLGGIDLSFLSFIIFIAVIASFVQLVEMVVEKFAPGLYNQLGIFLPLIAVNCAIMGASLFMQERATSIDPSVAINTIGKAVLVAGHCDDGRNPRKDRVQRDTRTSQGARHRVYYNRAYGHRVHVVFRNTTLRERWIL